MLRITGGAKEPSKTSIQRRVLWTMIWRRIWRAAMDHRVADQLRDEQSGVPHVNSRSTRGGADETPTAVSARQRRARRVGLQGEGKTRACILNLIRHDLKGRRMLASSGV